MSKGDFSWLITVPAYGARHNSVFNQNIKFDFEIKISCGHVLNFLCNYCKNHGKQDTRYFKEFQGHDLGP